MVPMLQRDRFFRNWSINVTVSKGLRARKTALASHVHAFPRCDSIPSIINRRALKTAFTTRQHQWNAFDILSVPIEAYEDKRYPIDAPEPVELIKAHLERTGCGQGDLATLFESSSRASEVLTKRAR